jgi:hypothetical protein
MTFLKVVHHYGTHHTHRPYTGKNGCTHVMSPYVIRNYDGILYSEHSVPILCYIPGNIFESMRHIFCMKYLIPIQCQQVRTVKILDCCSFSLQNKMK